jgi:glycosyltransferase involved in cell wall biosynthesis
VLGADLAPWHARVRYIPNGLDREFLASEDDIRRLPEPGRRPILGYLGVLSQRTDLGLLFQVASRFNDCDLHIAGWADESETAVARLLALPNVRFLGRVPFSHVARTIDTFDVCLLPHRNDRLSRRMSPLKVFQYLGRGRPVVTTDVAGLDEAREFVRVVQGAEAFIEAIERSLRAEVGNIELRRERVHAMRAHTWDIRVNTMWQHLMAPPARRS